MSGRPTDGSADPQRAVAALLALVAITAASNLITSFNPALAFLKLCLGLLNLAVIGAMCGKLWGLARPRLLASAWYMLLGQIVCITYVYVRSALSLYTGMAGISLPEVAVLYALLATHFARRHGFPKLLARARSLDLTCRFIWLGWIFVIAFYKLDLLYTPSSDPDVHAWYARHILTSGRLFYDLLPLSDVPVTYAGGFASMNLVLGRLSGLHPVQLVNLQPYLQQALFAGCSFSLLAGHLRRGRLVLFYCLTWFSASGLVFNPLFVNGRAWLEGTPRLSHTALLFFPLFFLLWNGNRVARRPFLLLLPAAAVLIGLCTNPAHAPASLLMAAVAASLAALRWRARALRCAAPRGRWLASAFACLALAGLFVLADPFYRDAAGLGTARDPSVDTATNAFSLRLGAAQIAVALRSWVSEFALPWQSPGLPSPFPLALWSAALSCALLAAARAIPALRDRLALSPGEKRLAAVLAGAVAFMLAHGFWCELIPALVRVDHVAGRLLVQYSWGVQRQAGLLFFALLGLFPLLLAVGQLDRSGGSKAAESAPWATRGAALAIVLMLAAAALPARRLAAAHVETFLAELRTTPLGEVRADDLRIAAVAEEQVREDERVLLPGRLFDKRYERWVLPTGGARAVPHFSRARTAFFAGLDGTAFSAEAYALHVRRQFDPEWLRAHRVVWLLDNGEVPRTLLERHYERVAEGEQSSLWRLRPGL